MLGEVTAFCVQMEVTKEGEIDAAGYRPWFLQIYY
jgi:hypothetical protein